MRATIKMTGSLQAEHPIYSKSVPIAVPISATNTPTLPSIFTAPLAACVALVVEPLVVALDPTELPPRTDEVAPSPEVSVVLLVVVVGVNGAVWWRFGSGWVAVAALAKKAANVFAPVVGGLMANTMPALQCLRMH
jgi:hypothetical protein